MFSTSLSRALGRPLQLRRRLSVLLAILAGSLALLVPRKATAQEPARPDFGALCRDIESYVAQHPEIGQAMAQSHAVRLTLPARQALVVAMVQHQADSAAAVLRPLIPDTSDAKIFAGITRLFQAIAALPDTGRIGQIIRRVADDADLAMFKFVGELPDTLFNGFIAAGASQPQGTLVCAPTVVTPPPSPPKP